MPDLFVFQNLVSTGCDEQVLLDNCSATVYAGDCIILSGPSGVGKSLLLQALSGLLPNTRGELFYNGISIADMHSRQWRSQLHLLPQQPLLSGDSVTDALQLPYQFTWYSEREWGEARAQQYLEQLGKSEDFLTKRIEHLSGGERQIVQLVRSLLLDPNILLLDEPTAALDRQSTLRVEALIHGWLRHKNTERAVVWLRHDSSHHSYGNRQWVMNNGQLSEVSS